MHKYIDPENGFIPLEDNKSYKRDCEKCRVQANYFPLIRGQLNQLGINASTMFPDLQGLCEYLNFTHLPHIAITRFSRLSSSKKDSRQPTT